MAKTGRSADTARGLADRHDVLPAWRCVLAIVEAESGNADAARAAVADLRVPAHLGRLVTLSLLAEAALALDDETLLRPARDGLASFARRRPVNGYGGLVLEPVDRTLARLVTA